MEFLRINAKAKDPRLPASPMLVNPRVIELIWLDEGVTVVSIRSPNGELMSVTCTDRFDDLADQLGALPRETRIEEQIRTVFEEYPMPGGGEA